MKITEHFDSAEFDQKAGHGQPASEYPPLLVYDCLLPLCQALEVLREELGGHPVTVTSGYRSADYNRALAEDGHHVAAHSQHIQGRAADIVVEGVSPALVHLTALRLHQQGRIRLGGLGAYLTFTHLDVRPGNELALWSGLPAAPPAPPAPAPAPPGVAA